jgi:hypothetical protein
MIGTRTDSRCTNDLFEVRIQMRQDIRTFGVELLSTIVADTETEVAAFDGKHRSILRGLL